MEVTSFVDGPIFEFRMISAFQNCSKGGGGILLNSYKVVEIFVHIIYESTLGVYGKVLGISRHEKKKFEFSGFPCLTQGWIIFWAFSPYLAVFSQNPKLFSALLSQLKATKQLLG